MTYESAKFKVRVGVVLFDPCHRILLARQNNKDFWVLPGGTLEEGEPMDLCAIRELKEEANLEVEINDLLSMADFFAPNGSHVIDVVFRGTLLGGHLQAETDSNLNDIAFFTCEEFEQLSVRPNEVFELISKHWPAAGVDFTHPGTYLGRYSA